MPRHAAAFTGDPPAGDVLTLVAVRSASRTDMAGMIGAELRLPDGRRVLIKGEIGDGLLDIVELPSGRLFLLEDPLTGDSHLPDGGFLEDLSAAGDLHVVRRPGAPVVVTPQATRTYTAEDARRLDASAQMRLDVIRALRDVGLCGESPDLAKGLKRIWTPRMQESHGDMPRVRRVRDWYKGIDPETVGILDVMSMSGRVRRESPLDPALNRLYAKHAHDYWYESERGWSVFDATSEAAAERKQVNARRLLAGEPPLPEVNRETMRRRINALLCRDAYAAKWGEPAARRKFDGGGTGLKAARILEKVLMDSTVIDCVMVYDRGVIGRAYFTAALDVHSRGNLGRVVSMTPPSHHTAALCLRRANRSKVVRADRLADHPALAKMGGKPDRLIVDNGRDFCSQAFIESCADLGITVEVAPVGMPTAKPMIERFFHTLNQYLIRKLKGATLDPSTLRKLDIDPATEAVVTLETLEHLIEEFVHYYHTRVHSGIQAKPVDKWKRSMDLGHRHVLDSEEALNVLFGVVVPGRRITANGGVRIFSGLTYKSPDMRTRIIDPLAGREPHATRLDATTACTVKVRYDPADLGRIWVEVGAEWIPLDCTTPDYARGLSKWQHERIRAFARREQLKFETEEQRLLARAKLNAEIRRHFPDLDAQERRAASRFLVGEAPSAVDAVEHHVVEARHDGLEPIRHQPAHGFRKDLDRHPGRPSGRTDPTLAPDGLDLDREDGGDRSGDEPDSAADRPSPISGAPALFEAPPDDDERFNDYY